MKTHDESGSKLDPYLWTIVGKGHYHQIEQAMPNLESFIVATLMSEETANLIIRACAPATPQAIQAER